MNAHFNDFCKYLHVLPMQCNTGGNLLTFEEKQLLAIVASVLDIQWVALYREQLTVYASVLHWMELLLIQTRQLMAIPHPCWCH